MSRKALLARVVLAFVVGATLSHPAFASSGGSLPWEGPLQQIQQSITGPVAGFIALAARRVGGQNNIKTRPPCPQGTKATSQRTSPVSLPLPPAA